MFDKYSAVTSEDKHPFLDYREIVMARKKPRDIFVQVNTAVESKHFEIYKFFFFLTSVFLFQKLIFLSL